MIKMSSYWQTVLDDYKEMGSKTEFLESKVLYGRAEMMARSEIEISEAIEKVEAKS